jgi:hypothetical protein
LVRTLSFISAPSISDDAVIGRLPSRVLTQMRRSTLAREESGVNGAAPHPFEGVKARRSPADGRVMDALGTATSGLRAAQLQVDIAAENVANTNTPGYTPDGIAQQAVPGGVAARVAPEAAPPQLPGVAPGDQPSGSDLTTETVSQITGSIAYAANARVIDVSAQLTKNLIDVLA